MDSEWFEPWNSPAGSLDLSTPPTPRLLSVTEGQGGLLWVLAQRASSSWSPVNETLPLSSADLTDEMREHMSEIYETVVEVINPLSGVVVVSQRFPGSAMFSLGEENLFYQRAEDDLGVVTLHIVRAVLEGSE